MDRSIRHGDAPGRLRPASGLFGAYAHASRVSDGRRLDLHRSISVTLLEVAQWLPWLDDARQLLDPVEVARVQRRRFPAHRDALAIAYAMHRLVLGQALGEEPARVPLTRDDLGCPRLAGDVAFTSLSHADGLVALAVTRSGPVGIDIELRSRAAVMPELAGSVCHPGEAAFLSGLDECARGAAMLALWVRKEALLKAAGVGLAVPMASFAAPQHPALLVPGLFDGAVQVRMLPAGRACVVAVAGPTGTDIECRWLRPASGPSARADETASTAMQSHPAAAGLVGRDGWPAAFVGNAGMPVPGFSNVDGLPVCRSRSRGASP